MTRVTLGAAALSLPLITAVTVLPAAAGSHPAGTAFVDTGADVHSAFGSSSEPTTLIATFLGAPASGLLTIAEAAQVPCN